MSESTSLPTFTRVSQINVHRSKSMCVWTWKKILNGVFWLAAFSTSLSAHSSIWLVAWTTSPIKATRTLNSKPSRPATLTQPSPESYTLKFYFIVCQSHSEEISDSSVSASVFTCQTFLNQLVLNVSSPSFPPSVFLQHVHVCLQQKPDTGLI